MGCNFFRGKKRSRQRSLSLHKHSPDAVHVQQTRTRNAARNKLNIVKIEASVRASVGEELDKQREVMMLRLEMAKKRKLAKQKAKAEAAAS